MGDLPLRTFLNRIFAGRRGPDAVCGMLFIIGLVLSAAAWFTQNAVLGWLVYLPWAAAVLRMFSTRLEQRYQENRRFLETWQRIKTAVTGWWGRLRGPGRRPNRQWAQDGMGGQSRVFQGAARPADTAADTAYHHFVCPCCVQKLRVPRGRGRVEVTCPKCKTVFEEMA